MGSNMDSKHEQQQHKQQSLEIDNSLERLNEKITRALKEQFDQLKNLLRQLHHEQQHQLERHTTEISATGSEQQLKPTNKSANSNNNVNKSAKSLIDSLGVSLASDHEKLMVALDKADLPAFFGREEIAISWLLIYKHMADCHFLSEPIRLVAIRLVFFDEALFWYTKNWGSSHPTSWGEFEKKFIEAYIPKGMADGLRRYINNKTEMLRRFGLESPLTFFSELMKVCSHAFGVLPEMEIVMLIVNGMSDKNKRRCLAGSPRTVSDLRSIINSFDKETKYVKSKNPIEFRFHIFP